MSNVNLRLPDWLHKQVKELARREGVSFNQLVSSALAEKLAALMTVEYLEKRGRRGNRKAFDRALGKVKSGEPAALDR